MGSPLDVLAFWGDLRLWHTPFAPVEHPDAPALQEFEGYKVERKLFAATTRALALTLRIEAVFLPNPAAPTQVGFRGALMRHRKELWDRADRLHPVCWVGDTTLSRVVAGASGGGPHIVQTSAAHPYAVGDQVLIRRKGPTLYTLATVAGVPDSTHFTVASSTHAIAASDDVHRVDLWWSGMGLSAAPMAELGQGALGDLFGERVSYAFRGGPDAEYSRPEFDSDG